MLIYQNLFLGSFYSYARVVLVFLKKFLVTDQLELGKTKIHSQFLILCLHCWCNKKYKLNTTIIHTKLTNNNNEKESKT